MSNFSFSCSVFKRFVLQTCKDKGLFGKGLSMTDNVGKNQPAHFVQPDLILHCMQSQQML